jgi:lysophospholipase L1-like esterase
LALASHGDGDYDFDNFDANRTRSSDPIWEGLCVGASLNLSEASQASCARQAQTKDDDTFVDDEPNIGAGLCVGASLDLSQASQRQCERTVDSTGSDTDADHRFDHDKHHDHPKNIPADTDKDMHHSDKDRPHHKDQVPKDEVPEVMPSTGSAGYAALGDSVAAGLGLPSPVGSDSQCGRSTSAYAFAVASGRGMDVTLLACSGATLGELFSEQGVSGPNLEPQLDSAFASGPPQLITITAGANDIRWADFLRKCFASTCGTASDDRIAGALLVALSTKLDVLFQDIAQRSNSSTPQIIMTGYYNPLSENCAQVEPRITLAELTWLGEKTSELNQTLQTAATQAGAEFVPLDFTGHDICSSDPWVQTLDDPAPFHPTVEGQQAIAQTILRQ